MSTAYSHNVAKADDVNSEISCNFQKRILNCNSFVYRRATEVKPAELLPNLNMWINEMKFKMHLKHLLVNENISYDEYFKDTHRIENLVSYNWRCYFTGEMPMILPFDFSCLVPESAEIIYMWEQGRPGGDKTPNKLALQDYELFEKHSKIDLMNGVDYRLALDNVLSQS